MKLQIIAAASALALAACGNGPPTAIAKLDCPSSEGDLTRVSVAEDGRSCAYRSAEGAEVELQILPLQGDAKETLEALETSLLAAANEPAAPMEPEAETAPAQAPSSDTAAAAAAARAEAEADSGADTGSRRRALKATGTVTLDTPEGEVTRVDLPGIHISAKDDDAQIRIGSLHVDASDDKATVRMFRNVRMKGEQLSREKRGVRAVFIYTGKELPAGYRYVGYQAGGPKTGPLVVGVVRSKLDTESGDNINQDVEKLVRRNAGV